MIYGLNNQNTKDDSSQKESGKGNNDKASGIVSITKAESDALSFVLRPFHARDIEFEDLSEQDKLNMISEMYAWGPEGLNKNFIESQYVTGYYYVKPSYINGIIEAAFGDFNVDGLEKLWLNEGQEAEVPDDHLIASLPSGYGCDGISYKELYYDANTKEYTMTLEYMVCDSDENGEFIERVEGIYEFKYTDNGVDNLFKNSKFISYKQVS